ncbi:MAG: Maf family protein [Limisphaerales bacterium]
MKLPQVILASTARAARNYCGSYRRISKSFPVTRRKFSTTSFRHANFASLTRIAKRAPWPRKFPMRSCSARTRSCFLDREILGKPRNLADARRMLSRLQGRTHQVVTGVSLIHLRAHHERIFGVSTDVTFLPLTRPANSRLPFKNGSAGQGRCLRDSGTWRFNHL